jgi:hypothetical protein
VFCKEIRDKFEEIAAKGKKVKNRSLTGKV